MTQSYEEKQIATLVHGRYLVDRGEPAQEGRPLLVGFHGYGENAERHLEMLRRIPGAADWVICAVGALHRFYNTKTGDVIGSWMTSQQREQAIDDNVRYVAAVISALRRDERTSDVLVLAGQKRQEREEKDAHFYLMERSYGAFRRAFQLPADARTDQIDARFAKGVLTISVPRTPGTAARKRRIEIQSE